MRTLLIFCMVDYSDFSLEGFIMDDDFRNWVKYPTAESTLFWNKWLADHPDKAPEIHQARLIILSIDFKKTTTNEIPKALLLKRIQDAIRELNDNSLRPKSNFINVYYKVAAIFLGLLISTASLYLLTHGFSQSYTTNYGEIKHLTLPDGSKMVLNANSSVRFNHNWEDQEAREVWLEGEAFFSVIHKQDNKKFVVRTHELDVEVLGTEFNVKSRRNTTKVVLTSGKVKLNPIGLKNDLLYMNPGESVELFGDNNKVIKEIVNPEQFSSWKKERLIFKGTPLGEIAQTFEDNYGWVSTFEEDSIRALQFTGTVSTESIENIDLLLSTMSEVFDIEIVRKDKRLTFKKKEKPTGLHN